jgi:hypothetical protein
MNKIMNTEENFTTVVFTLLAIETTNNFYLNACKRLASEILSQTQHDVIITTNNVNFFSDLNSERCIIRNNIKSDSILKYGFEFNYNLKHHCFLEIPEKYQFIIYLDCDIKLDSWSKESDDFINKTMINYDFGADRLNCYLKDEVGYFLSKQPCLFQHKIDSHEILIRYKLDDEIMNSRLPSEHFLIMKNDILKVQKFQQKWEEMNDFLQSKNGVGGSWGDGFEIGISMNFAGFNSIMEMSPFYWKDILGFKFNGNKF